MNKISTLPRGGERLHMAGLIMIFVTAAAWHIGQWPGALTHDTIQLIGEAERGTYTTYHPILNALLFRLFVIPFNSIAVYSTLQAATCTSILILILHQLRKMGLPSAVTFFFAALISISIPIGSYKSMLWKDVPSSFAVLAFAFLIFKIALDKTSSFADPKFVAAYSLGLAILSFMRHGWELNLLIVPLLATILLRPPRKTLAAIWTPSFALALLFFLAIPHVAKIENNESHFANLKLYVMAQPFVSLTQSRNGYLSTDPHKDGLLINKIFTTPDAINRYNPTHIEPMLGSIKPTAGDDVAIDDKVRIIESCLLNINLCLTDRFAMFINSIYPASPRYGMTYYNVAAVPDCGTVYPSGFCEVIRRYATPEKSGLSATTNRILQASNSTYSPFAKAWIWNSLPSLALLLAAVLLSRWFPATSVAACFVLIQCAVPFATSIANDFRYYFFVYLSGFFIVPMWIAEAVAARLAANPSLRGPQSQ